MHMLGERGSNWSNGRNAGTHHRRPAILRRICSVRAPKDSFVRSLPTNRAHRPVGWQHAYDEQGHSTPNPVGATRGECVDVCHPFRPEWYNESLAADDGVAGVLSPLAEDCSEAFLIGNTKRLWPEFVAWWNSSPRDDDDDDHHPLDHYTRETIEEVVRQHAAGIETITTTTDDSDNQKNTSNSNGSIGSKKYEIFWAFEFSPGRLVSMQRIAQVAGLCYLDDATNMAIHPEFGPWLSFRAAILFFHHDDDDGEPPPPAPAPTIPTRIPNLLAPGEEERAREKVGRALDRSSPRERASELLIASRDCVSVGRSHRFPEPQLLYHYTGDKKHLSQPPPRTKPNQTKPNQPRRAATASRSQPERAAEYAAVSSSISGGPLVVVGGVGRGSGCRARRGAILPHAV